MANQIAFIVGVAGDEEETECPKGAHKHWITVLAKRVQRGRGTKMRITGVVYIYDCKGLKHTRLAKRLESIFKAVFKTEEMDAVRYPHVSKQEGATVSGLVALQVLERIANGVGVTCSTGDEDNLRRRKRVLVYVLANMTCDQFWPQAHHTFCSFREGLRWAGYPPTNPNPKANKKYSEVASSRSLVLVHHAIIPRSALRRPHPSVLPRGVAGALPLPAGQGGVRCRACRCACRLLHAASTAV